MPEPWSVPLQLTEKLAVCVTAGSAWTALEGLAASTVFVQVGVSMGALVSKTMVALLEMAGVPGGGPPGATGEGTAGLPSGGGPAGGRKPASGSSVSSMV